MIKILEIPQISFVISTGILSNIMVHNPSNIASASISFILLEAVLILDRNRPEFRCRFYDRITYLSAVLLGKIGLLSDFVRQNQACNVKSSSVRQMLEKLTH